MCTGRTDSGWAEPPSKSAGRGARAARTKERRARVSRLSRVATYACDAVSVARACKHSVLTQGRRRERREGLTTQRATVLSFSVRSQGKELWQEKPRCVIYSNKIWQFSSHAHNLFLVILACWLGTSAISLGCTNSSSTFAQCNNDCDSREDPRQELSMTGYSEHDPAAKEQSTVSQQSSTVTYMTLSSSLQQPAQ